MHNIDLSIRIVIANGPEIKETISIPDVEAYDEIIFELPPGSEKIVKVQPSEKEKVVFLLIKSSLYDKKIKYGVASADIALETAHLYQGPGGINGENPKDLKFKNDLEGEKDKAEVQILVGRKAVDMPSA